MSSVNLVILSGRIEKDARISPAHYNPEERIARLTLITTRSWINKEGGREYKKTWHKLIVKRDNLVNLIEKYVRHGSHIIVNGELRMDAQASQYPAEILVNEIRLGKRNDPDVMFLGTPSHDLITASKDITHTDDSLNMILLAGYAGSDPETVTPTNSDSPDLEIVKYSLATTRSWTNKSTNERQERTTWHSIYTTRDLLKKQVLSQIKKGQWCMIVGEIGIRKLKPLENSDTPRYLTEINLKQLIGVPALLAGQPADTEPTITDCMMDSESESFDTIPF
jgi:single-strand DNA-binding protein